MQEPSAPPLEQPELDAVAEAEKQPATVGVQDAAEEKVNKKSDTPPAIQKSSGRDFWLCIGILLLFLIVCAGGAAIISIFALANKEDLFKSTRSKFTLEAGGVVNPDNGP